MLDYPKLEEYKSKIGDRKINESITIALKLWELDLTETKDKKEVSSGFLSLERAKTMKTYISNYLNDLVK
jgi:hypothetical protein